MTSRFRRSGRGQQNQPYAGPPAIQCPSCGMLNDPSARFCRNCGLPLGWPQDPVRGTMMRQADLPSERGAGIASIVGLVAAVAILAAAAFLVFRGSNGTLPQPTSSPRPTASQIASASATPGASSSATPRPTATSRPTATPNPTEAQSVEPTAPGSTPPPALTAFTCDPATIANSAKGRWAINLTHWVSSNRFDTIKLDMKLTSHAGGFPSMTIEEMSVNDVVSRFGMNPPPDADKAVVVTLDKRFSSISVSTHPTNLPSLGGDPMPAVPNFALGRGTDGQWHAVLAVVGNGCERVGVPAWVNDPNATDAVIMIDVQH